MVAPSRAPGNTEMWHCPRAGNFPNPNSIYHASSTAKEDQRFGNLEASLGIAHLGPRVALGLRVPSAMGVVCNSEVRKHPGRGVQGLGS